MKRYIWVGLLLLSNSVYALFEDDGARKKLNEIQDQINALQSSIEFQLNEKFTNFEKSNKIDPCLLYTSPSPRDRTRSRMPSSA